MIIARLAFCNIVSNIGLQKYVCSAGIKAFVIADPIPNLEKEYQNIELSDKLNIVNICSFSDDEPYNEVIKAAEYLEKEASFYITGNFREKIKNEINYKNITFTGYLERDDYLNLLASADLIIVLTLRENCLLCGAYEALFFEKPLILSRKNALIDYFGDAAIYCENRAEDIAEKVLWAKNNMGIMKGKIILGRKNIEIKWGEQMEVFNKYIELIA